MFLEPILLESVYVERPWGGLPLLASFHPHLPSAKVGESWDISSYPTADCRILNGEMTGEPLSILLSLYGNETLGRPWDSYNDFPLLIKFLAPVRDLALQVHPADIYAHKHEGQNGKTECWLVLAAEPGAMLWLGLKDVASLAQLDAVMQNGNLPAHVQRVEAKEGDVFFIPAGLVHGLGKGILAYEVQQNSDVTYRLDDFGMGMDTPEVRKEHQHKGLEVIDLTANLATQGPAARWGSGDGKVNFAPYFGFELKTIAVDTVWNLPHPGVCKGLTVLEGGGSLHYQQNRYALQKGQPWLLPAIARELSISGPAKVLITFFP